MQYSFGAMHQPRKRKHYKLENVGAGIPIPPTFTQDISWLPINNQRQIPACGAHAGVTLKLIQEYNDGNKIPDFSPRYLWNKIKRIDHYSPEEGTDIYSIFKALLTSGVCDMTLLGNDTLLDLQSYTNPYISPKMDENASKNKIASYATTDSPTFDQLKQAIYVNKAVIVLLRVGKNMYTPSWRTEDIMPLNPTKYTLDSGHFMTAYAYDEKYIYMVNEWGNTWAMKGIGFMGSDYVPYIKAMGTAVDVKNITPDVVPMTLMQKFLSILSASHVKWDVDSKSWKYF